MDSGNSGSMQSSSGGDEEYDSRSEGISSFLNPSAHFGSVSHHQQASSIPPLHDLAGTLFNPHSQNNLDVFPTQSALANNSSSGNTNTTTSQFSINHDLVWSRGLRSEPINLANFGNVTASSSSQSILVGGVQGLNSQSPSIPTQGMEAIATTNAAKDSLLQSADHQPVNMVKNPKKRTRASRRAPTTVLTTDTTNFRQMVQEFTGIPTAPFSAAGSPYSRRLDLFSTSTISNMRSAGHLADSLGPLYPLRPSTQKMIQLSPFGPSSNTMIDALVSSSTTNTTGNVRSFPPAAGGGTSNSTVMPPDHLGLPKQPQNLLNMQNQMLSFQPLLLNKHHPSSILTAGKTHANTSLLSFDELGLGHHDHQNVNANLTGWKDGGTLNNAGADHENLGASSQHLSSYKFNSEFHHDKGLEINVSSGVEGTVGSWICPSD